MNTATVMTETDRDAAHARIQDHVEAPLGYLAPSAEKPALDATRPGERVERNFILDPRTVRIANGWLAPEADLDREGFALTRHETGVQDFEDAAEIEAVYYPEIEALLKESTGASRVLVFDHNLRLDAGATGDGRRPPVRQVHNDYTERSAPRRLAALTGRDAAAAVRRFAVVNVWRPIRGPVETAPLALADARSVAAEDLIAVDLVYPDRIGEVYHAAWSPRHRWVYYPCMDRNEALLIKGHDSRDDGRARVALHTAFDDPTSPPDAAPRESTEGRAAVLVD
jgi:hypothetical protein